MKEGIVGNGEDKFTEKGKQTALDIIQNILSLDTAICVSGRSPLGGVDVWAEDCARFLGREAIIWPPVKQSWSGWHGYKWRNEMIAKESDHLHVVVADVYPLEYSGYKKFKYCYHCKTLPGEYHEHVKSGACWTAKKTLILNKPVTWYIVNNYGKDYQIKNIAPV